MAKNRPFWPKIGRFSAKMAGWGGHSRRLAGGPVFDVGDQNHALLGQKWAKMTKNGQNWLKIDQNRPKNGRNRPGWGGRRWGYAGPAGGASAHVGESMRGTIVEIFEKNTFFVVRVVVPKSWSYRKKLRSFSSGGRTSRTNETD